MKIYPKKILNHQKMRKKIFFSYNNVIEAFLEKEKKLKMKDFLIFPGKKEAKFSYSKFKEEYLRTSLNLRQYRLKKGDKVSIIFFNQPEFFLFYFACLSKGLTVVPINPDLSSQEINFIIQHSEAKLVIYTKEIGYKLNYSKKNKKKGVNFLSINSYEELKILNNFKTFNKNNEKVFLHDNAVIIYTSGTTGNPKGVVLTHMNLLADSQAIGKWFKFSDKTITMCILPLFHNNGQVTTFLAPMLAGGSSIITPGKTSILNFWNLVEKYNITWTSIMASILSMLLSFPKNKKKNTLKAILCGGQILTKTVRNKFEKKFNVPVFEGFGLTETTSFACINNFPAKKRKEGSIGKPLPINEMAIIDDKTGKILSSNMEGEICIRGYNVASHYLKLTEKNKKSFSQGWFHSGDYGRRDQNNYFYFHERRDSLIIKGGENIYPAEIENVIYKNHLIQECAVIGIKDEFLGENICAFIRLKKDHSTNEEEIKENLKGKIAGFKQPKEIIILNNEKKLTSIPKGPTKKILYRELRRFYEKRE